MLLFCSLFALDDDSQGCSVRFTCRTTIPNEEVHFSNAPYGFNGNKTAYLTPAVTVMINRRKKGSFWDRDKPAIHLRHFSVNVFMALFFKRGTSQWTIDQIWGESVSVLEPDRCRILLVSCISCQKLKWEGASNPLFWFWHPSNHFVIVGMSGYLISMCIYDHCCLI